jgi:surfeit locus 1 family protein
MWSAPQLQLPAEKSENLTEMEYRSVKASGRYDFDHQIALRNQYWQDQYGYHLLVPLVIESDIAVLVDRGWIPAVDNEHPENWHLYTVPESATVIGIIRPGQSEPQVGGVPDPELEAGQDRLSFWNNVNIERISAQMPYDLLPIYIQLDPIEGDTIPPIPYQPEIELTEGPHLGYAGQWFTFATILLVGYPFYLNRQEKSLKGSSQ